MMSGQGVGFKMEIRMTTGRVQTGFLIDKENRKSSYAARRVPGEMPLQMMAAEFLNLYYLERGF
jgi:hypothetical protein